MSIFSTFNMLTWKQTDAFTLTLTKYDHNNESAVEQRSHCYLEKRGDQYVKVVPILPKDT